MKIYEIPNYKRLEIKNILLDINGTIQFNGKISVELKQKIMELKQKFKIILISADTRGNLKEIASELDLNYEKLTENRPEREQKGKIVDKYNKENTIAIGNGNNDELMLKKAALEIIEKANIEKDIDELKEETDYTIDDKDFIVFNYNNYFQNGPTNNFSIYLIWEHDISLINWRLTQKTGTDLIVSEGEQNFTADFNYHFILTCQKYNQSYVIPTAPIFVDNIHTFC